jgi:hypothetical protein
VIKLADELREKKVKIGFFSSTPQGGKNYRSCRHSKLIVLIKQAVLHLSVISVLLWTTCDPYIQLTDASCSYQVPDGIGR